MTSEAVPDIEDFRSKHDEAIRNAEGTYIDPSTGFVVFSELTHLKRGKCCGNRCRHCPYGFDRVQQARRVVNTNGNGNDNTNNNNKVRVRGSWRKRRAAAANAAAVPIPGAPVPKLRSGDKEKAQSMVRAILERAGKWNEHEDDEKNKNDTTSTSTITNTSSDDDDDDTSTSSDASSTSDSTCSSCSSRNSDIDNDNNNNNTTRKATTTTTTAPNMITVIKDVNKDIENSNSTTATTAVASTASTDTKRSTSNRQTTTTTATTTTTKNVPYTRGGDQGTSQLGTGERRSKTDDAFEAMGSVDELCSFVGVAHAHLLNTIKTNTKKNNKTKTKSKTIASTYEELPVRLLDVMSRLFDVGSHVAKPRQVPVVHATATAATTTGDDIPTESASASASASMPSFVPNGIGDGFDSNHVDDLEDWINEMTEDLPELTSFILPTGAPASAALHVARTVCRRAERRLVPLVVHHKTCDPNALRYLNRLSDYFFVAARWVNYKEGQEEIEYRLNNDLYGSDDGSYDDGSDEYCDSDNDNNSGNDKTPVANTHDQRGRVHRSLTTTATK